MSLKITWSARTERDFTKQIAYLEKNVGRKATTQYMNQVTQALEQISSGQVSYQLVDATKGICRYKVNKHTDLYYKQADEQVVLVTFFDSRQDPGKLKV